MLELESCLHCSSTSASFICSRCKSVRFCNRACQEKAWGQHKSACRSTRSSSPLTIWGFDPTCQEVAFAGVPPRVPVEQLECLLHFVRDSRHEQRWQRKCWQATSPQVLESARHATDFEGVACPVVDIAADDTMDSISSTLQSFFRADCQHAVIIRGMDFLPEILKKWMMEYLCDNLGECTRYHTFRSSSASNCFTYFLDDPLHLAMSAHECKPATESLRLTFQEFYALHRKELNCRHKSNASMHYFQAPILIWHEDGRTEIAKTKASMYEDLTTIDLKCLIQLGELGSLGRLARSTLFCSGRGALSPLHYDQAQNLYFQMQGAKRFLLFPPELGHCFYPYPVVHPMDLRARVDLGKPDFAKFPQLRGAVGAGIVADLQPGDLLYLPSHWWHQVQSVGNTNISLNFWFYDEGLHGQAGLAAGNKVLYPLSPAGEIELVRQIELFLIEMCDGPGNVDHFLHWLHMDVERRGNETAAWEGVARYVVRRTVELVGEHHARRLLDFMLHPRRWSGLPKRSDL